MNPILLDFPGEFETERLLMRMPTQGDGKAIYEAINASRNELKPWIPFAQKEQSEEEVEVNNRETYIKFLKREKLRFLIFHHETDEFIGISSLNPIDWEIPSFEVGYWADTRLSGKGYMTEAVDGITRFAFHELHANRVEIRCDESNAKSRSIPERLNFILEGILIKDDVSVDGKELRDTCVYAKYGI